MSSPNHHLFVILNPYSKVVNLSYCYVLYLLVKTNFLCFTIIITFIFLFSNSSIILKEKQKIWAHYQDFRKRKQDNASIEGYVIPGQAKCVRNGNNHVYVFALYYLTVKQMGYFCLIQYFMFSLMSTRR